MILKGETDDLISQNDRKHSFYKKLTAIADWGDLFDCFKDYAVRSLFQHFINIYLLFYYKFVEKIGECFTY